MVQRSGWSGAEQMARARAISPAWSPQLQTGDVHDAAKTYGSMGAGQVVRRELDDKESREFAFSVRFGDGPDSARRLMADRAPDNLSGAIPVTETAENWNTVSDLAACGTTNRPITTRKRLLITPDAGQPVSADRRDASGWRWQPQSWKSCRTAT